MADDGTIDGKGKAKATQGQDEKSGKDAEMPGQTTSASDLGSRIADSTRGLLRDALTPGYDAASTLKSSLGEKGGSSSSGSTHGVTHGFERSRHGPAGDFPEIEDVLKAHGSFREAVSASVTDKEFEQFESTQNLDSNRELADASNERLESAWKDTAKGTTTLDTSNTHPGASNFQETDGAAVVALLADPSFNVDTDTVFPQSGLVPEQTIDDLFPHAKALRQQSGTSERPQPPIHKPMPTNHPLALKPRSDEENRAIEQNINNIMDGTFTDQHLSASQTDDAWISDWLGVLDSYTDEVWGDMLPIVRETRAQLDEIRTGTATIDSKAVARLKMIIGHLQLDR
jgi:hypothetical protein